jgi:imidazolonepropionase-like amidohydrolase
MTAGNYADFLILNANPLENIRNMREIEGVFVGGVEVEAER